MSITWVVELEFAYTDDDMGYWEDYEDVVHREFLFSSEEEAREFFLAAYKIVEAGWEDNEGTPSQAMLEFPREHNVTVFDIEGYPIGGFMKGEPVPGYKLSLIGTNRIDKVESLTDAWLDEAEATSDIFVESGEASDAS